jgi:hypothetical protein
LDSPVSASLGVLGPILFHRFSKMRAAQIEPNYSVKIGAIMIKVVTGRRGFIRRHASQW